MNADVERFEPIDVARRIEKPIDRFGVVALRFEQPDDGSIGLGGYARRVRRIIDELGCATFELRIEFARERLASARIAICPVRRTLSHRGRNIRFAPLRPRLDRLCTESL